MEKILVFACNENKTDLAVQFYNEKLFEVYLIALKLMDKLDIIEDYQIAPEKIFDYPSLKKKWMDENGTKSVTQLEKEASQFEETYNVRTSNLLISYNYGRSSVPSVPYIKLLQMIRFEQDFCLELLERVNPSYVLGELSRSFYLIMFDLCNYKGITYLHPIEFRATYYGEPMYTLTDDKFRMPLLEKSFESIQCSEASPEALEFSDSVAERMNNPARYNSKNLTNFEGGKSVLLKKIKYRLKRIKNLTKGLKVDRKFYSERLSTSNFIWSAFDRFVLRTFITKYKMLVNSKYLNKKPNLTDRFIYFPLHFYPETTSSVFSSDHLHYYDQELHLIQLLSKSLPSGYKLYVKEHLPMIRTRKKDFYVKVKSFYNVTLIHPQVDSLTILKKSSAAISIVGTVGIEALLNNIPVLTFSGGYYAFLKSVYKIKLDDDINSQLNEVLKGDFSVDKKEVSSFFSAFYDGGCPFKVDKYRMKSEFEVLYSKEAVHSIAKYIKKYSLLESK